MAKKTLNLKHISSKLIASMGVDKLKQYSNIRTIVNRLAQAMNKRIDRLGKSDLGQSSPTYQRFEKKGYYTTKGLSDESLYNLYENLSKSYLSDYTSIRGFQRGRQALYDKLGLNFKEKAHDYGLERLSNLLGRDVKDYRLHKGEKTKLARMGYSVKDIREDAMTKAKDMEKQFWKLYRMYGELNPDYQSWVSGDSSKVISYVYDNIMDFSDVSLSEFSKVADEKYRELKQEKSIGQEEDAFLEIDN